MKSKALILLSSALTALLLSGCALPMLLYADTREKRALATRGPENVSVIDPAPRFLTDELAVARAQETLTNEGYKTNQWHFTSMHGNRTQRVIRFTNQGRFRLYSVRLRGHIVSCHSFRGTQRDFRKLVEPPKTTTEHRPGQKPIKINVTLRAGTGSPCCGA